MQAHEIKTHPSILVVEDSDDDFEILELSLKKFNFENPTIRCEDGQDALDCLFQEGAYSDKEVNPCLIMLDLNMPRINGMQVLEKIKTTDNLKKIPVIILTTSSDERDVERCYRLGANSYVQKQVNLHRFFDSIKTLKEYWMDLAVLPK